MTLKTLTPPPGQQADAAGHGVGVALLDGGAVAQDEEDADLLLLLLLLLAAAAAAAAARVHVEARREEVDGLPSEGVDGHGRGVDALGPAGGERGSRGLAGVLQPHLELVVDEARLLEYERKVTY